MRRSIEIAILILVDAIASCAALAAAFLVRNAAVSEQLVFPVRAYVGPAALLAAAWVALFAYVGLYGDWGTKSRLGEIGWVLKAAFFGGLVLFLLTFQPDRPFPVTRIVLVSYGASLIVVSVTGRLIVRGVQRLLFARGRGLRNALVVGTGARAREFDRTIRRYPRLGMRVIGFLTTNGFGPEPVPAPVLGDIGQLRTLVDANRVSEVVFAEPALSHETVLLSVAGCEGAKVRFSIVPDLYDVVIGRSGLGHIYGMPLMPLFPTPMPVWQRRTKRLVDIVVALCGLVIGSPLFLGVALAVWSEDRGPVFYSQERVGREARRIHIHKFRSMVVNAEKQSGPVWAQKGDPRITKVGRFIRRTRLDELPQFWNILRGDMSLVGPRPERPFFVDKLAAEIPLYRRRLHVTPGLTGWAQTKQAYDASLDDVREKLKYDLYYIENMSLGFDLLIVVRTIWVVLTGKGAQ